MPSPARRPILLVTVAAWVAACGGGNPSGSSSPTARTTVTQQYVVQKTSGETLCTLSYQVEQGSTLAITAAEVRSRCGGSGYDAGHMVVRESPSSGFVGRFRSRTTVGTLADAASGETRRIYVANTANGLDPVCLAAARFGERLPHGRRVTVRLLRAGEPLPREGTVVVDGHDDVYQGAMEDIRRASVGQDGVRYFELAEGTGETTVKGAFVTGLGGSLGWHSGTGFFASPVQDPRAMRAEIAGAAVEELTGADDPCGMGTGGYLYAGSNFTSFAAKGPDAWQYAVLMAPE